MKKKIIFCFILSIILRTFTPILSFAENIKGENINLYIQENFKKDIYKPGDSDNLKFIIENNTDGKIKIKNLYFSNKNNTYNKPLDEMSKYTNVIIKNNDDIVIESLLKNLLGNNKFKLNIEIEPHKSITFDMHIDIDKSMGNEAQNVYQELYINTDYEVHNDGHIEDNDNGNSGNENDQDNENSGNNNDQDSSENESPQTGDSWNNYPIFIIAISTIIIIVINRKKIENKQ